MSSNSVLFPYFRWGLKESYVEIETLKEYGLKGEIYEKIEDVTDKQWQQAAAIISIPDIPRDKRKLLKNCKIHVTAKVGYDNIDLKAWGEMGIPVCNVPNYGTADVADHAIGLMLSLMKGIALHSQALKEDPVKYWRNDYNPFGKRLSEANFGVIGLGRIGTATALRAKAFGMNVVFYDPYLAQGVDRALGIRRVDYLEELLSQCHVVSIHANLTDETNKMINHNTLSQAKRGMIILNTARGDIIDLEALYEAMRNNIVAAAGLDVLPVETKASVNAGDPRTQRLIRAWCDNEDWIKERLILTPHSAYLTKESSLDMRKMPIRIVASFINKNKLINCVNEKYLYNT